MMDTKMRKKKVLAIVLSVVLALSTFVACNSSDSSDSASDNVNVDVASGVGVSSSTHTDIELTTTTESNTERRTTERVTTETTSEVTTEATTHAAQQEKTTEATTEATTSAHSTSTSAPAPTTEATTAATTATATVATTEARECQHNWITQVTQIDHPAVTHTETRTFRKDTGEDVTGQQLGYMDGIYSIRTGSYTVYTCQCGFQGSSDEVEAHQRQYSGTDERPQHGRVQTHTEYTYAEVEDRTITVVDQEAWTENRVTSYVCTICGATREAGGSAHNDNTPITPIKRSKGSFIDSIFTFWRREDT